MSTWPISNARGDVRDRIGEVLDAHGIDVDTLLVDALTDAANELWTAEQVAKHTGQKPTSVPSWVKRHGVARFTGAVYSRTAVVKAKAAMPGPFRGTRQRV